MTHRNVSRALKVLRAAEEQGATIKETSSGFLIITEHGRAGGHWSQLDNKTDRRGSLNLRSRLRKIGIDLPAELFRG